MEDPKIAQKAPYVLELEQGTYYWCSCGKSSNNPFATARIKGVSLHLRRWK